MIAAVYRATGAARDVLRVEEVDCPAPGLGEVLVRVRASGANPTDYKTRSGAMDAAAADITAALSAGALTELPVHRFPLREIAAAHEAAEGGAVGKVIVEP